MKSLKVTFLLGALLSTTLNADFVQKTVQYSDGETDYAGVLVYDASIAGNAPAIYMVPNWMGVTDLAVEKAKQLAGDQYVIFVADMYGEGIRPKNAEEAAEAAAFVRGNRTLMRDRALLGLDTFLSKEAPVDAERVAAIGFCFGGGTVLEMGRSGVHLDAIISFHGDLTSPTLQEDAGKTKAKVLALHGAADPYVPQSDVQTFIEAMLQTDVDWQFIQYSNTVHSFTDPSAKSEGKAMYHPQSARRAYEAMYDLLDQTWSD